ncbi:hypothetical protein [Anaerotignum sp.]|uniref:hypothetical protein n=1 Tax=Anaerotignum sp. TaxID=2039241 RepID=UPI003FA41BF1
MVKSVSIPKRAVITNRNTYDYAKYTQVPSSKYFLRAHIFLFAILIIQNNNRKHSYMEIDL